MEQILQTKTLRIEDVKPHSSAEDLWMIIYNKVYDITEFSLKHPGGIEVLIDCGGVDATEAFEDVAHSDDALDMLEPYFIGDLDPSEHKPYRSSKALYPEAEKKVQRIKDEKTRLFHQRQKKKHFKENMEKVTIFILMVVAVGTILFYLGLQHFKLKSQFEL